MLADRLRMISGNKLDKYTKVLLHMNGADASTSFIDETGRIWTKYGNAQIDTTQSKFGGASGLFDGTGDYIDTPDSDDFYLGTENFTIDFWVRLNVINTAQTIVTQGNSFRIFIETNNNLRFSIYDGTSTRQVNSTLTMSTATWYHIALVRNGNTLKIYANGVEVGTTDLTLVTIPNSTYTLVIGNNFGSGYFNGWVDEFRFSKGIARWTANFTPPNKEY
jgi:hypothetical protein